MANLNSTALVVPILLAAQATSTEGINPLLIIVPIVAMVLGVVGWYIASRRQNPTPTPTFLDDEVTEPVRPAANRKGGWASGKTTSAGVIAMLEILEGPDGKVDGMSAGRKIEIFSGRVRIGRSSELCDLQLYDIDDNSTISRRHCTIEFDRALNTFVVIDEGSRSGTRVGNTLIEANKPFSLKDGDVIELGFVEQSGARLRFTSPIARAARRAAVPVLETAPVKVPVLTPEPKPVEGKPTLDEVVNPDELVGIETLQRNENTPPPPPPPPVFAGKPGTGPLSLPQTPCDIFMSYSRKDRDIMQRISNDLGINGITVWTDENLTPGTPLWRQAIETAIESAGCVIVILSPDAKQSPWVQRELDYASTQDKPIIPLLVGGDQRNAIPLTLISAQWADLRENYDVQFTNVLTTIKKTIDETKQR